MIYNINGGDFMFNSIINTENFIIRPFEIEDIDNIYTSWGKDEKMFLDLSFKQPCSKSEMKSLVLNWIKEYENDGYNACFSILKDNHSIGFIRTKDYKEYCGGIVSIECGLSSEEWNKGIMSECLLAFAKHLLLKCGINRVEARCNADNKSINRVLEKCGMTLEGRIRESGCSNRSVKYDENMYSLLRKDI